MSKGSKRRPTNETAFGNNFDSIDWSHSRKESPLDNAGYESCKETDTPRTEAAQDRALVNR